MARISVPLGASVLDLLPSAYTFCCVHFAVPNFNSAWRHRLSSCLRVVRFKLRRTDASTVGFCFQRNCIQKVSDIFLLIYLAGAGAVLADCLGHQMKTWKIKRCHLSSIRIHFGASTRLRILNRRYSTDLLRRVVSSLPMNLFPKSVGSLNRKETLLPYVAPPKLPVRRVSIAYAERPI